MSPLFYGLSLWAAATTIVAALLIFIENARHVATDVDGSGLLILGLLGTNMFNHAFRPWPQYLLVIFVLCILGVALRRRRLVLAITSAAAIVWALCFLLQAPALLTQFAAGLYIGLTSFLVIVRISTIFSNPKLPAR